MLGASLRWNLRRCRDLAAAVDEVMSAGFERFETCGVRERDAPAAAAYLARRGGTLSVHAPCPDATQPGGRLVPGDWLASGDASLRQVALRYALGTIDFARAASIGCAVYHLGRVETDLDQEALVAMRRAHGPSSAAYRAEVGRRLRERARRAGPYLERARAAVEALLRSAGRDIVVCIENRYRFDQIPTVEDARRLCEEFGRDGLAYWHDAGHAHVQEHLCLVADAAAAAPMRHLAGTHLHDALGTRDHLAPGTGEVDFAGLLPVVRRARVHVLELDPGISPAEAAAGREHLAALGY